MRLVSPRDNPLSSVQLPWRSYCVYSPKSLYSSPHRYRCRLPPHPPCGAGPAPFADVLVRSRGFRAQLQLCPGPVACHHRRVAMLSSRSTGTWQGHGHRQLSGATPPRVGRRELLGPQGANQPINARAHGATPLACLTGRARALAFASFCFSKRPEPKGALPAACASRALERAVFLGSS